MNITYRTAVGKHQIIEFCQIAKTHRLCIPGWNLICDLNSVVNGYTDPVEVEISLAYDGDKPVAIALKHHTILQCFVRAAYRRKGIGSEVIKLIHTKNAERFPVPSTVKLFGKRTLLFDLNSLI